MGSGSSKPEPVQTYNPVLTALEDGISRMKAFGLERITLSLHEASPRNDAAGAWIFAAENQYFPFESLSDKEKKFIMGEKNYERIDLVLCHVPERDLEVVLEHELSCPRKGSRAV